MIELYVSYLTIISELSMPSTNFFFANSYDHFIYIDSVDYERDGYLPNELF